MAVAFYAMWTFRTGPFARAAAERDRECQANSRTGNLARTRLEYHYRRSPLALRFG
jgi:hypothetical protein